MSTEEKPSEVEEVKSEAPPEVIDNMLNSFNEGFGLEPEKVEEKKEEPKEETTPKAEEKKEESKEEEVVEEKKTEDTEVNVEELLDIELKRFDQKMSLKEYLKKYPDDIKEALQKKWDYNERKESLKQEKASIEEEKKNIETVILRNIAHEINMPLKSLDDFKNDVRFDDPEEEYDKYIKQWESKARNLTSIKAKAESENADMIEDFTEEFKDVSPTDILQLVKPYLNASVSMGHVPFPKDALKVFYRGKNYDKLVEVEVSKAREDERKKVFKELKKNPDKIKLDNSSSSSKIKESVSVKTNQPPIVSKFESMWD